MDYSDSNRKHFGPKQVRTLKGIKIGTMLFECNNLGGKTVRLLVKITGEPYQDEIGWFVKCERSFDRGKTWLEDTVGLEDQNVLPYTGNGQWNRSNWLERL